MLNNTKVITSILLIGFLAACGGGGGGNNGTANPPATKTATGSTDTGSHSNPPIYQVDATARFNKPTELSISGNGELLVLDNEDTLIRKISATGEVSTVPGSFDPDMVWNIASDLQGSAYVMHGADLLKITPDGGRTLLFSRDAKRCENWSFAFCSAKFYADPQGRWYPVNIFSRAGMTCYTTFRYGLSDQKEPFQFCFTPDFNDIQMDRTGNLAIVGSWGGTTAYVTYIPASAQLIEHTIDATKYPEQLKQYKLPNVGRVQDTAFDRMGNLLIARTYTDPERSGYHKAGIVSMAPDGTVTTLWEGFPDGSTESRPDTVPYRLIGLAVAENGTIFASDSTQHALYKLHPSTRQSIVIAGKPGESGNSD